MVLLTMANGIETENDLVEAAGRRLAEWFPGGWSVEVVTEPSSPHGAVNPARLDGAIELRAPNGTYTRIVVEARRSLTPRDAEQLLPGLARTLRALASHIPLLVVAPWLSDRTQQMLVELGINYVDLTGNARLQLDNPTVFIRSSGATRNPSPRRRGAAGLRGAKAARLVRLLADVRPPYGVRELAVAASVTPGYVSRVLDSLDREALIERSPRGGVADVDVPQLLRAWAESYDVLAAVRATQLLAPDGASRTVLGLARLRTRAAITGSFAAARLAPVAAPSLLLAHCEDVEKAVEALGLLPADEAPNVILLDAFDSVVFERTERADGLTYAAPSQVAVDCLTGNGRMPAEGEALLTWMSEHEPRWRLGGLDELKAAA